jgi:hypothetical protein
MLMALVDIPLTLILNFALIRSCPRQNIAAHFNRSFLLGLILPGLQMILLLAASIGRW